MSKNAGKTDAWCGVLTAPGVPCENPAGFEVCYGPAPDDSYLACEGHVEEEWQPTFEVRPLTPEDRARFGIAWEAWLQSDLTC